MAPKSTVTTSPSAFVVFVAALVATVDAAVAGVLAAPGAMGNEEAPTPLTSGGMCLLSTGVHLHRAIRSTSWEAPSRQGCAALSNAGTHFTAEVEVGSPGQTFSLVADTGSNALIIPSCLCQEHGACSKSSRCFRGTNRSSTFELYLRPNGQPEEIVITFGSGQIAGVIAKDRVTVGGFSTFMEDGLLLMVNKALNIPGPFEGILGLGLPRARLPASNESGGSDAENQIQRVLRKILEGILGGLGGHNNAEHPTGSSALGTATRRMYNAAGQKVAPMASSFLEQAQIDRFSVCLDEEQGVLRLDTPAMPSALGSVGKIHWALDFQGISIGSSSSSMKLALCSPADMLQVQETPCSLIPDSGTTLLMGPAEHIDMILEAACDAWERCATNHSALVRAAEAADVAATEAYNMNPWSFAPASKAQVLAFLLTDCARWLDTSEEGLAELPSLHFHVAGPPVNGTRPNMTLELRGEDYIVEHMNASSGSLVNGTLTSCSVALAPTASNALDTGPVWIMGLPLFYAYHVSYDAKADPPSVGFVSTREEPCGSCDQSLGLVSTESRMQTLERLKRRQHRPRQIAGPPRWPSWLGREASL